MEILKNFGIQPVLLLAQIINFLIILFLLKKFFYKPIVKALQDRKQKIEESLKNADLIEEKLAQTEEKSVKILEEARNNAKAIFTDAKKEAQNISDQANVQARETIEEALNQAKIQIEAQRKQMQKDLEEETLGFVAKVVKKVLGRNLKAGEKQSLTRDAAREITKEIQ